MSTFGKKLFAATILTLGLAVAVPADAQFGGPLGDRGPTNDNFGGNYKDPQQKAADHLAKGMRFKQKADQETDAKKKAKLMEKAVAEFKSSNALHSNHDALLALGLIAIERGDRKEAMNSCWNALGLRKDSPAATECYEQAKGLAVATQPAASSPSGN